MILDWVVFEIVNLLMLGLLGFVWVCGFGCCCWCWCCFVGCVGWYVIVFGECFGVGMGLDCVVVDECGVG